MTCNNCLQEIVEGELFLEDEDEGTAYHVDCRQAAIDRRNKAEAENRRLAARVAELEAQLAAQGWRPVTEEWPPYGVQHLGRGLLNSPTLLITRTVNEGNEVWQDSDGLLFYAGAIRYCAAIPAPQETE